jgi:hypothetical protein
MQKSPDEMKVRKNRDMDDGKRYISVKHSNFQADVTAHARATLKYYQTVCLL